MTDLLALPPNYRWARNSNGTLSVEYFGFVTGFTAETAWAEAEKAAGPFVAKAIAAELRAQADAIDPPGPPPHMDEECSEYYDGLQDGVQDAREQIGEELRARANDLDPAPSKT